MSEFKCEHCGKEYKREAALKKHIEKEHPGIEEEALEEQAAEQSLIENEVSEDTVIVSEIKRRIEKLKIRIRDCYDAETKHRLEGELKDLKKDLKEAQES